MPAATNATSPPSDLRARVAHLRHELSAVTDAYYAARRAGRGQDVIGLLRRRSSLIRELFQTQSELLVALRSQPDAQPASFAMAEAV